MQFERIEPAESVGEIIECYWALTELNPIPEKKKIIPDGFPEIIFHTGDPYRFCIDGSWKMQERFLFAGQCTEFFYLENCGATICTGIKFKPAAPAALFQLSMIDYVDRVVPLNTFPDAEFKHLEMILSGPAELQQKAERLDSYFSGLLKTRFRNADSVDKAIHHIFTAHGMVSVRELCQRANSGTRQLLNSFKKHIGVSPKMYARIIRLNYIFQLVQEKKQNWTSLAYDAAYFDQAHFIKDFNYFTGENPGKYPFDKKDIANFFLMPGAEKTDGG